MITNTYAGIRLVPQVLITQQPSESRGPGSGHPDVGTQRVLVGGRRQGERVVLVLTQLHTGQSHPLTRLVLKVRGALELHFGHVCG